MVYQGTELDAAQAVQAAFSDADQAFRVDAKITANISAAQEVIVNSEDDSVTIGDASGNLATVTGGALNVNANVSGTFSSKSEGLTGATAPTYATELGAVDSSGKLQALLVDPSGKLLVDTSGTSTITGTVDANINGLSTFQTSQYSVSTSSVQLTPTPLTNRSSMSIKANTNGTDVVYIGNSSSVTTSTGYALFNGDSLQIDLTAAQVVYAIASGTSPKVYVLEIGD